MNIIKFPEPQKKLSEEEEIEIARQEILAEVRLMEAQGLLDFVEIEQQPGEVIQLFRQDKSESGQATDVLAQT